MVNMKRSVKCSFLQLKSTRGQKHVGFAVEPAVNSPCVTQPRVNDNYDDRLASVWEKQELGSTLTCRLRQMQVRGERGIVCSSNIHISQSDTDAVVFCSFTVGLWCFFRLLTHWD